MPTREDFQKLERAISRVAMLKTDIHYATKRREDVRADLHRQHAYVLRLEKELEEKKVEVAELEKLFGIEG